MFFRKKKTSRKIQRAGHWLLSQAGTEVTGTDICSKGVEGSTSKLLVASIWFYSFELNSDRFPA